MFFLAVILLGYVALRKLSVDLLPEMPLLRLLVMTRYADVSPEEIETFITVPLEASVCRIPGIRRLESISREGLSLLVLEFTWGTDMEFAVLHTREKLDSTALPRGAEDPLIVSLDPGERPIMILALSGERSLQELNEFSVELVKPRLEQLEGVGSAEVVGGVEREIQVIADPRLLSLFGVTVEEISQCIEEFDHEIQGGIIRKGRFQFALRVSNQIQSICEIGEVALKKLHRERRLKLKDVARIRDSLRKKTGVTRLNGRECIGILIRKESGSNTVRVTHLIRQALKSIIEENPDVNIPVVVEHGRDIEKAISSVLEALLLGAILAFVVLVLFLHDFVTPFIIAVVIPISISATFNLLYFQGITLNVMSLGGLALGVGMLVDNSIVVSESIARQKGQKRTASDAAQAGTDEVRSAVTASTLTTISVFVPLLYIRGVEGHLFKDQAFSVASSLLSSLFVSLTLLPMLSSLRPLRRQKATGTALLCSSQGKKALDRKTSFKSVFLLIRGLLGLSFSPFKGVDVLYNKFSFHFHRILLWCLDNKGKVIVGSLVFMLLTFTAALKIPRELLPWAETVSFTVEMQTPAGFSLEQTAGCASIVEEWLGKARLVRTFFSEIGIVRGMETCYPEISANSARIRVAMQNSTQVERMMQRLRERLEKIPGLSFSVARERSALIPFLTFSGSEIKLRIRGNDLVKLDEIACVLASKMAKMEGIVDVRRNTEEGKQEYLIKARENALERYGILPEALNALITDAVRGRRGSQLEEGDRRFDIVVRGEEREEQDIEALLDYQFVHRGNLIPLRELLDYTMGPGPKEIRRENQQREVLISANLQGKKISQVIPELEGKIGELTLPPGYRVDLSGEKEMRASFQSLFIAFLLAAVLVYMIMAAQFESLLHPLLILFTLPMGLSGAVWGLFLFGETINVISIIGIVVLTGIVVNDAIVKVDYTNQLRRKGFELREAILEASRIRLKSIIMTTVTTVLGLFPLALGLGSGSELQKPLAIPVIGGLMLATFLTLILIPIAFEWVEKRKR
jgi:HAE1 family hydrophobic/amphiphilic exporter-1